MKADTRDVPEFRDKLFVVDKAVGPSSFDVVAAFRRATKIRKVGHTGTLDPRADGVLLICTGIATRAAEHFVNLEKEYLFTATLGVETSTLDAEGEVMSETPCPDFTSGQIVETARSFVGDYEFTPPAFSALKKDGKRLYESARAGEAVEPEKRTVTVYDCVVKEIDLPHVTCSVRCSRGTYVRSLARDFGMRLGIGAHVSRLTRARIGPFERAGAFPSEKLVRKDLAELRGLDLARALDFLPGVVLEEKAVKALRYGTLPGTRDVVETIGTAAAGQPVRILDQSGVLLAVGRRNPGKRRNPLLLVDKFRMFAGVGRGTVTRR